MISGAIADAVELAVTAVTVGEPLWCAPVTPGANGDAPGAQSVQSDCSWWLELGVATLAIGSRGSGSWDATLGTAQSVQASVEVSVLTVVAVTIEA